MLFTFDRLILMYLSCDIIFSLPSSTLFFFARETHFFKINPSGKINKIKKLYSKTLIFEKFSINKTIIYNRIKRK